MCQDRLEESLGACATDRRRGLDRPALRAAPAVAAGIRHPGQCIAVLARLRAAGSFAPANPLRVLFIGNSHTFYNGMPDMIAGLAQAAGVDRPLQYAMEAPGGCNFETHLASGAARQQLSSGHWDFVVLQEQQQRSAFTLRSRARWSATSTAPRARSTSWSALRVRKTILYMTAARRDGDPEYVPGDTYEQMQERTREGYRTLAARIGATLAPAGLAWRWVRRERPDIALWMQDGSHPSPHGSYLIACALFAALYGRSPRDNPFTAGTAGGGRAPAPACSGYRALLVSASKLRASLRARASVSPGCPSARSEHYAGAVAAHRPRARCRRGRDASRVGEARVAAQQFDHLRRLAAADLHQQRAARLQVVGGFRADARGSPTARRRRRRTRACGSWRVISGASAAYSSSRT